MDEREVDVAFEPLGDFETIAWDYETSRHSTRDHPLGPLRAALAERGLPDARTVAAMQNGSRVSYAGVVITRQRPSTAKGVVFMTMEDETGFVNVVIWKNVFDRYRILAKTSSFLGVTGKIQSESGVVHVVADSLWEPNMPVKPHRRRSRDFH
jgi:error-prone DNA polymerase